VDLHKVFIRGAAVRARRTGTIRRFPDCPPVRIEAIFAAISRGEGTRVGQRAACSSERRAREGPQRGSPLGPIELNPLSRPDVGYRDRHRRCRGIEILISTGGDTTEGWFLLALRYVPRSCVRCVENLENRAEARISSCLTEQSRRIGSRGTGTR